MYVKNTHNYTIIILLLYNYNTIRLIQEDNTIRHPVFHKVKTCGNHFECIVKMLIL